MKLDLPGTDGTEQWGPAQISRNIRLSKESMQTIYNQEFFEYVVSVSKSSAAAVVPIVVDLIKPRSVLDIGCGPAEWLEAFRQHGAEIQGVDGYAEKSQRAIPEEAFLEKDLSKPLNLGKSFDLVVTLEVAEHLPEESAETFVSNLTNHGQVILFSAAIPFQGGLHHVNEQWPSYWAEKFLDRNYICIDYLRPKIWWLPGVCWFYAQNMLLFIHKDRLEKPDLSHLKNWATTKPMDLVHPDHYLYKTQLKYLGSAALAKTIAQRISSKILRFNRK